MSMLGSRSESHISVAVVGSGLAGLSATIEAYRRGAHVYIFEKEPRIGGNSAKASSGMNAVDTYVQHQAKIPDSETAFFEDTESSGGGLSDRALIQTLVSHAKEAHTFLESFGLKLDLVSQCGGHRFARTHRESPDPSGKPVGVGWDIIKALRTYLDAELANKSNSSFGSLQFFLDTRVTDLVAEDGFVRGVRFKRTDLSDASETTLRTDAVVLASGGFSASSELLAVHAPALAGFPTTNGAFAQGDGLALGTRAGAALVDIAQVQLHPTAFVSEGATRILAPESLRAHGAWLASADGTRIVDERATRRVVAQALLAHPEVYLVVTPRVIAAFGADTFRFYVDRGLFSPVAIEQMPALRPRLQPGDDTLYRARVAPAVHYCMGGLRIDPRARVLHHEHAQPVPGLYAAGEVTGGLHGKNRLAGNSLLDCVVFGRIAGQEAALGTQFPPALVTLSLIFCFGLAVVAGLLLTKRSPTLFSFRTRRPAPHPK